MVRQMQTMKKVVMSLLACMLVTISYAAHSKVDAAQKIMVNGMEREYWLYVPDGCPDNAPMVVAMHGTTGHMTDKSPHFNNIADTAKFVVVYPQGLERNFPVFGGNATGWASTGEYSEDVDFIRTLVEEVGEKYQVDRKRVYCCGFSNGGMNTYSLTNFCTDIFAAFGSISGFPINEFHMHHVGARPVPFIHIHGKADVFVKYSLVPIVIENMVARNGANPVPVRTSVKGKYDKNVYQATEGGFPVVFYEIDGMGHNDFTANTEDGNSSLTMWKFFRQYTLDSPCDASLKWRPNIEAEGYEPTQHGWSVNAASVAYLFGRDLKTDANQNVYRSLQFTTGNYKLCFHIEGVEGTEATVRLSKLTGNGKVILNKKVVKDGDVTLPFKVEDGWGEYKFAIGRKNKNALIKVTGISIYSVSDDDPTGVKKIQMDGSDQVENIYSIGGVKQEKLYPGINILQTKGGNVCKVVKY